MQPDSPQTDSPIETPRWDSASAQRRAASLGRWASLGSFGLMVCLWLAIIGSTWSVHETAINRAMTSANNLSAAFSEQVYHTLSTIDAAMDLTAREIRDDPTGFRLDQWSKELPSLAHPTMFVSLVDASGKVISTTIRPGVAGIELSDLEAFNVHLALMNPRLYISEPMTSRVSGRSMIEVSRRVDDANGHFIGILVFALAPDDLTSLYRSANVGPRGIIALVGADGLLRARFGGQPEGTAAVVAGEPWPVMLDQGATESTVQSSAVDGIARIYSIRRLPSYPLTVAVGLSFDDELAEARSLLSLEVYIGVAATTLLIALNLLLVREIRRRNLRELELVQEHAALESARAELLLEQGKLASVNRELVLSSERAEAANLAKSQFLAQMSHELRTPLHAVIGFSELISHNVAPMPSAGMIGGYADDIMKSGRHLLELINSILDLSKVESGNASLVEQDVALQDVIKDSLVTIREQAGEAGVAVDTSLPGDLPEVHGDATKLRQIFINLLSNAVKFTQRGGTVTVSGRREPDNGFAVLFADTGIGMTDLELGIAMEPFGQVENSFSRSFEGTGLGLPLARRMTELHGGRLTVRSVKGVGTTVEVYLPPSRILWSDTALNPQAVPVASD
ncbi:MAG: ATP-binding protein [Acetobacteraceae bacterium]|jgi:two-component system, cell cycle sensor histidine kinase PleC